MHLAFHHTLCSLADAVVKTRAVQALDSAAARYPIHRVVRCAVRRKLEDVMDDLALDMGFAPHRLDQWSLLLEGHGTFIAVRGSRQADYTSLQLRIWCDTKARAVEIEGSMLRAVGEQRITEQMFSLDWKFMTSGSGLSSATFEEIARDELHDEAYPTLGAPVAEFIRRYLDSSEIVLILQGAPGSGKTRLVRAILAEMSRRKGESADVMFTADKRALENDEIYVDFITGYHDAFVIEDADHLLMPRADGNQDLHRFLSIADGVVRAQGRKIIFTTNIPNIRDIDEALLRPGRCHAIVHTRSLDSAEAARLVTRLSAGDEGKRETALARLAHASTRTFSVADVYKATNC